MTVSEWVAVGKLEETGEQREENFTLTELTLLTPAAHSIPKADWATPELLPRVVRQRGEEAGSSRAAHLDGSHVGCEGLPRARALLGALTALHPLRPVSSGSRRDAAKARPEQGPDCPRQQSR